MLLTGSGAFVGTDYIYVQNKLPMFGVSVGLGLTHY